MKPLTSILLFIACFAIFPSQAQTPYDAFAPETSRPMLGLEAISPVLSERPTAVESMSDSAVYAIVIDPKQQSVYLLNLAEPTLLAAAPLTDDVLKWLSVDPLSDKYPNISPYAYCNWNPIMNVDPDGRKVVGHSVDDVETFVQDIGYILKDPKFNGYRDLIKQEGNRIGKISRQDFKTWKAGAELSPDEGCYVDLLTTIINAHQTCTIEYLETDLCKMSPEANAFLSENSPIFRSVQGVLPYFGGAITNGEDGMSAYSVIAKAGESVTNPRAVNSMHEVLGHGYAFIRGFSNSANQVQALRVENLVRRLLGLPANDGSTHPHPKRVDLTKLPKSK